MGKRGRQPKDILPEIEEDEDDLSDLPLEARDVIAALGELEGASDAKWKIHRIDPVPEGKSKGYCGTFAAAQFSLENMQRQFGKGKYRVIGHTSAGQYIKGGSKDIEIASDPPLGHASIVAPSASGDSDVLKLLSSMNEREERRAEKSSQLWALALPAAIAAIPSIMQVFAGNKSDPLQMIAALKTLQPSQPDMSGLVTKLIEVAADKSGGGSSDTNWMDLVKEGISQLGPVIGEKIASLPTTNPAALPRPPVQITATSTPAAGVTPATQPAENQGMLALLSWAKKTLAMLCEKAAKAKDSSLYADVVLDDVPEGVNVAQFVEYLNAPNWWTVLQQFYPGVAPYEGWFAQFREDLLGAWEESQRDFEEVEEVEPKKKARRW